MRWLFKNVISSYCLGKLFKSSSAWLSHISSQWQSCASVQPGLWLVSWLRCLQSSRPEKHGWLLFHCTLGSHFGLYVSTAKVLFTQFLGSLWESFLKLSWEPGLEGRCGRDFSDKKCTAGWRNDFQTQCFGNVSSFLNFLILNFSGICCCCWWNRVSLYSWNLLCRPGCPWISIDLFDSVSQVQELRACTTTWPFYLFVYLFCSFVF